MRRDYQSVIRWCVVKVMVMELKYERNELSLLEDYNDDCP